MKIKVYIWAVLLITSANLSAQSLHFLNHPVDARQAAMGNAGYVSENTYAVQQNISVSMLDNTKPLQLGLSYLSWQPAVANNSNVNFAGYYKFSNFSLGAGIRHSSFGEIMTADTLGNLNSQFVPVDYTVDIGMAYRLNELFVLGSSVRYINSDIGGLKKASVFAADLSLLYAKDRLSAGVGVTNIGTKVDYGNGAYHLPTRIRSGASYVFLNSDLHKVNGSVDISYQITPESYGLVSGLGVEYGFKQLLYLRSGYHFEQKNIGASYGSCGIGLSYRGISYDFSYLLASNNNPVHNTLMMSLRWSL